MGTEIDSWIEKHTTQGAFCPMISATVGDFRALFAGKVLVPVELLKEKPLPELMMATYHEAKGWNDCVKMLTASQEPKK